MSDKWEVVTKGKKSKSASADAGSNENVATTNGQQRSTKKTLKMEDIRKYSQIVLCTRTIGSHSTPFAVPRDKLNSLYSLNNNDNNRKKSPVNGNGNGKSNASNKPKLPDALIPPQKQKSASVPHRQRPKNLEAGLAALDIEEVATVLESYRSSFPDSHLVWLKAVSHFRCTINCVTTT